jgi:Tfp pilus assembly protein PilV
MMIRASQTGFSAVELMITLFIGVAFIGSGYQLYGIAITDGRDARLRTQASSIAYSQMRTTAASVTNPCTTSTPTTPMPANSGLVNSNMTTTITCPYGTTSSVSAVTVTLTYGNDSPQKQVTHALYVSTQ